jgi:Spy/CpxP family protein refolding chaperone
MTSRLIRSSLLSLAAVALSGSIALSQDAPAASPAPPAPPAPAAPQASPRPRMTPRPPRGNFEHGRPAMSGHDGFRGERGGMRGSFGMGHEGMWWKNPRVVENLSLTPDQVKRMDGIFQESRIKLIDLHANVQKQEVMLEPLLSANPLDTAKAQAQIDKVADARAELEKTNARMLLGIRAVLTPDQWTKLHDRRGPGEPGGPGAHGPHDGPGSSGGATGPGRGPGAHPGVDHMVAPDMDPGL